MSVKRAASAGLWSALDIALRQGVQFAVSVVLARILMPADFGIIALLSFFSALSIVFAQGGLPTALIQRRESSREEESAVFWCNLGLSLAFSLLLLAIAPAVARFYNYPVLAPLMAMAAAQVVASALGSVQSALMTRELNFAALTKAGVVSSLVGGVAGVAAALLGAGVWALAIQVTLTAAVNSAALWLVSDWRPALTFRFRHLKGLFSFGIWFSLSSVLEVLYTQGFALVLGKLYGARELGLFNRASSTQLLPTGVLSAIIGRIALPLFAGRTDDPEVARRGLRAALSFSMLINLPMMVGISLLADLVIRVLFGDKWLPAAPILAVLAWLGAFFPVHVLNLQMVLAQGRSRTYFNIEIAKKVVGIAAVIVGSFFGIMGLAIAQVAVGFIALFLNSWPVHRSLGYSLAAQFRDMWGILLATGVMAGAVLVLRALTDFGAFSELALLSTVGAACYFATGFLLRLPNFVEAAGVAKLLLRRERAAEGNG